MFTIKDIACFALFVSIYWGVMMTLAENADNVLDGAILYEAVEDQ